jgi:hypothetical protein
MKSVIIHGTLAVIGLALAYWTWTRPVEEETAAEGEAAVTLIDCEADEMREVVLEAENKTIVMQRREERGEHYFWFRVERAAAAAPTKAPGKAPEPEERREQFAGGSAAAEYAAKVLPLRALRSLGEVPRNQLDELGLENPTTKLRVVCGGRTRNFDVGTSTFGASTRYAREAGGRGPIYLFDGPVIGDLEAAEFRLMQRDLHGFEMGEVDEVKLAAQGQELRMLHRNRRDPRAAEWVNAAEPDRRNETYGNWLERLARLRILSYLAPGARVPAGATPAFTLEYSANREDLGRLEVVRAGEEYFARSESTRTWVKVLASVAQQLEQDLPPLLGLESTAPTTPPAPALEPWLRSRQVSARRSAPEETGRESPPPSGAPRDRAGAGAHRAG